MLKNVVDEKQKPDNNISREIYALQVFLLTCIHFTKADVTLNALPLKWLLWTVLSGSHLLTICIVKQTLYDHIYRYNMLHIRIYSSTYISWNHEWKLIDICIQNIPYLLHNNASYFANINFFTLNTKHVTITINSNNIVNSSVSK